MKQNDFLNRLALLLMFLMGTAAVGSAYDMTRPDANYNDLYLNCYDFDYDEEEHTISPNGYFEVTYQSESYNSYSGEIDIPSETFYSGFWGLFAPIKKIGRYAFRDCNNLTKVTIGANIESLGYDAFWNCTSLTELTVPDGVNLINNWCFENCSSMSKITLGDGLLTIGNWAFAGCTSLRNIYCYAMNPPTISSGTFPSDLYSSATLYVHADAVEAYKAAPYWSNFTKIYAIPGTGLQINSTNFPDANFRSYLLSLYPNGYLTQSDINSRKSFSLQNKGISNLQGIQYFTALEELRCYNNSITTLNLSQNTHLLYLDWTATTTT